MAVCREGADVETVRGYCPSWTEDQLRLRGGWLHTCDERAVRTSFDGFHADDIHQDLSQIAVPSLLIVAGKGDVIRAEDIDEILKLSPRMRIARVPNARHMIPWDDERGFYQAFGDFLGAKLES